MLAVVYLSQQCMAKRFDGSQQALDLNNIRTDPGNSTLIPFFNEQSVLNRDLVFLCSK